MKRNPRGLLATITLTALALSAVVSTSSSAHADDPPEGPPGLTVSARVPPPMLPQLADDIALALDDAITLTEQSPADFGYAWVDRANNSLVIDAATSAGEAKGRAFVPSRASHIRPTVRSVAFSHARLEQIKNEAIELNSKTIPDGDLIYRTAPDAEHNRILITVEQASGPLFAGLVARYGAQAIAVEVGGTPGDPQSRPSDSDPFYGGARIYAPKTCTSAFPWQIDSTHTGMLTAGHCSPTGGYASTGAEGMGSITSGSRESWKDGTGSVPLTGSSYYHGDIALIAIEAGDQAGYSMYRGGPTSNTSTMVREMWSRRAQMYDKHCLGGATTGERCGWSVYSVGVAHKYNSGEIVRPSIESQNTGTCSGPGDSGGPHFTVRPDGYIAAKGIHSGGGGGGGDNYGGAFDLCFVVWTDIWDAWVAFPGSLRRG